METLGLVLTQGVSLGVLTRQVGPWGQNPKASVCPALVTLGALPTEHAYSAKGALRPDPFPILPDCTYLRWPQTPNPSPCLLTVCKCLSSLTSSKILKAVPVPLVAVSSSAKRKKNNKPPS